MGGCLEEYSFINEIIKNENEYYFTFREIHAKINILDIVHNKRIQINFVGRILDYLLLKIIPPSNRLEKLTGKFDEFFSIRINDWWRIIFKWNEGQSEEVKIVDYH